MFRRAPREVVTAPLPPLPPSDLVAYLLNGAGRVGVVSRPHHQAAMRDAVARWAAQQPRAPGEKIRLAVALLPEPGNPYDPQAVSVHIDGCGQVGHLTRTDARAYRAVLHEIDRRGHYAVCRAAIFGGGGAALHYGVWLDLAPPHLALTR